MADDDELQLLDVDLGELLESFTPSRANVEAGLLLGIGACVAGAVVMWHPIHVADAANWDLPWYAEKPNWSWFGVGFIGFLGAAVFAIGVALLAYSCWQAAHRVDVCVGGFCYVVPHSVVAIRWGVVRSVMEVIEHEHLPEFIQILYAIRSLLRPKPVTRSYTLTTWAGRVYAFDGNSIRRLHRFGQLLREQSDAHSIAWATADLRA